MKFTKSLSKKYYLILISLTYFIITTLLQVDKLFFDYNQLTKYYWIVKVLYLFVLIMICFFVYKVIIEFRNKNECYLRGLKIFAVYYFIMIILTVILWPGVWAWDDIWVLIGLKHYSELYPWQHIITGLYQDVLLQILPFPSGIIVCQSIIISICVAFCVTRLELLFPKIILQNKYVDIVIKIIPFMLPPILSYQFSGYRMGLYIYLELVMIVCLLSMHYTPQSIYKPNWDYRSLLNFVFLSIIVSTWRTESFIYIPCNCFLILFVSEEVLSRRKKTMYIIVLVIGFVCINKWQNSELGNSNYKIVSLCRPCVELIRAADHQEDAEALDKFGKVLDIECINNNPELDGEILYWSKGIVKSNYTVDDYHSLLIEFIKLSIKYPNVVIAERWNTFIWGLGINGPTVMNGPDSARLFDDKNTNSAAVAFRTEKWILNRPIVKDVRKAFIYALACCKYDGTIICIAQFLIWNATFPIIFIVYAWFELLYQKKWFSWIICTAILLRIPLVILAQPAGWLMYLLSFYFLGYVYAIYRLLLYIGSKRVDAQKNLKTNER